MDTITACTEAWIDGFRDTLAEPRLLFVSGAQGIGKSTALRVIAENGGGRILTLSLDDFYLTRNDRLKLAETVHPLFETRGPPGTHDLGLLNQVLDGLLTASEASTTSIPIFDKSTDDRAPRETWRSVKGQPEIIVLEGWMMGVLPDTNAPSAPPTNEIEAADKHGIWRKFQEDQLTNAYARLWDRADSFLHLDAPSFETVLDWRLEQERSNLGDVAAQLTAERTAWVTRFILHYERLTRRMLAGGRCDGTRLRVDQSRHVIASQIS